MNNRHNDIGLLVTQPNSLINYKINPLTCQIKKIKVYCEYIPCFDFNFKANIEVSKGVSFWMSITFAWAINDLANSTSNELSLLLAPGTITIWFSPMTISKGT